MKRPKPFGVRHARVRVASGPREDGRWYWRADTPDGQGGRVKLWTGWGTAEEAADAVHHVIYDTPYLPSVGELGTVRDLLECWVASVEDRVDASEHTIRSCRDAGRRLLAHGLGAVALERVTRVHLEQHRDAALRTGVAGSTVVRDMKYLRQAWGWGIDLGEIGRPLPRLRVERKAREPVRTRYTPTAEEVVALLQAVSPAVRRAMILLSVTGARIGEVMSLTWGAIAPDCRRVQVEGKTGRRWVALPDVVAQEIATWDRGTRDKRVVEVAEGVVRASLARHSEALFGERLSPNGLRRYVVDTLYATGQIDAAASQLGHSAQTALGIYRQVQDEDRARLVHASAIGSRLSGFLSAEREKQRKEREEEYSQGEYRGAEAMEEPRQSRTDNSLSPPVASHPVRELSETEPPRLMVYEPRQDGAWRSGWFLGAFRMEPTAEDIVAHLREHPELAVEVMRLLESPEV